LRISTDDAETISGPFDEVFGDARLEPAAGIRDGLDERPEEQRQDEVGFEVAEGLGRHALDLVHQFGNGDDGQDDRFLGEDDGKIHQRRQRGNEAERQQDAAHDGGLCHADGAGGLDLAVRHGAEARAEDFREIGAAVDGEAEETGRQGVEPEADQRAAVVKHEELHEEGRAADDLDIDLDDPVQPARAVALGKGEDKAERHAEDRAQQPAQDRRAEAAEKAGAVLLQDAPVHQIAVLCSR
jgi:hypothetical protein